MKKNSTQPKSRKRATAGPEGPITIGMDLGDKTSRYCVLGENGERLAEGRKPRPEGSGCLMLKPLRQGYLSPGAQTAIAKRLKSKYTSAEWSRR